MSQKILGKKETIVIHNSEINNQKYDLVITPHTNSSIHSNKTTNNKKNYK